MKRTLTRNKRNLLLLTSLSCLVVIANSFSPAVTSSRILNNIGSMVILGVTSSDDDYFDSAALFIDTLMNVEEDSDGMKFYFDDEEEGSMFIQKGNVKSFLRVAGAWEFENYYVRVIEDSPTVIAGVFEKQASILCHPTTYNEFQRVAEESLAMGMFFSLEELEAKLTEYSLDDALMINEDLNVCEFFAGIITQEFCKNEVEIDREGGTPTVILNTLPEEKKLKMFNARRNARYRGYVTNESETSVTCNIPMCISLGDNDYQESLLYKSDARSELVHLTSVWSRCQENLSIPEGIALADSIVPETLHRNLMQQIDALADNTETDYHPYSNGIVRDLVHPALYSYVKGVSPTNNLEAVPPATFPQSVDRGEKDSPSLSSDESSKESDYWDSPSLSSDESSKESDYWDSHFLSSDESSKESDYWGREYEASAKYQWLPTYFDIAADGSCSIADYINNLVPRADYEPLYVSLSQLFSEALPLIESSFSYGRNVKARIRTRSFEEEEWFGGESTSSGAEEVHYSLRDQRLQVITKIVDYELKPGQTYEGVWHVEGMSHEEIVATAIYFIHRDDDIKGGDILFKRSFFKDEAKDIAYRVPQTRYGPQERMIEDGLTPLGTVETLEKRLLVFPNSHVHKVSKIENCNAPSVDTNDTECVQKRRIIVFFLVNPDKRIVSTREVPPQQKELDGNMSREEAMEHRLELMKERKYSKQDWNIREIELCEH